MGAVTLARLAHRFYKMRGRIFAQFFKNINRVIYSCDIVYQVEIDKSCSLPHQGLGVVIHPKARIGKNCMILQNVTIGARDNGEDVGAPVIGDNVRIGCGAILLGSVHIGSNVVIAANAVVLHDVPDDCMVAGVPARVIKRREHA